MKASRSSSPIELAAWAGVGSLLLLLAIGCASATHSLRYAVSGGGIWPVLWANRLGIVVSFVPFVLGAVLLVRSQKQLCSGIEDGLWSDDQLQSLRGFFGHPVWTVVCVLCLVAMVCGLVQSGHPILRHLYWAFLIFLQSISQLRAAFRPKAESSAGLKDPQSWRSIHSDQWGEPARYDGSSTQQL